MQHAATTKDKPLKLSQSYQSFLDNRSFEAKLQLVQDICNNFKNTSFKEHELPIVEKILAAISRHVETKIRQTVAELLKDSDVLPRNIAKELANDLLEVSSPILSHSSVLTDEDLVDIINHTRVSAKLEAIANRPHVSQTISSAIVISGHTPAIGTLLKNKNADIAHHSYQKIIEQHREDEDLLMRLMVRSIAPEVKHALLSSVSDEIKQSIHKRLQYSHQSLQPETISALDSIVMESEEMITLDMASKNNQTLNIDDEQVSGELHFELEQLKRKNKLSHSILLRSLCKFDLNFFRLGLATLADIPIQNAIKLSSGNSICGFNALYKAAGMPDSMEKAAEFILRAVLKIQHDPQMASLPIIHQYDELLKIIEASEQQDSVSNLSYFVALIKNHRRYALSQ